MALGARAADLVRMVVAQGLALCALGMTLGLIGAVLASRLVGSLLYGVGAVDPVTYAASALVLVAVASVASYLPARRATRIDPVRALRQD
jgi:putative ABC transport system permease protein